MNSCVLMARVIRDPELRATQDQTSVATMLVEFESTREGEAPGQVKVEGWGNLAETMRNSYRIGSQVIIEGRLSMNTITMDEGYKQKVAKLVASRIFALDGMSNTPSYQEPDTSNVVEFAPAPQPQAEPAYTAPAPAPDPTPAPAPTPTPASSGNEDWDEIPF